MPLFTNVNLGVPKPLDLENYQATFGERLSASFEMGLEANPMSILTRSQKMSGLDGFDLGDSQLPLDAREIIDVEDFAADYAQKALPLEDQARQIKEAGLEGQLKPVEGYRQEALDIVIENKRMENVISAMNPGFGASLLGGLAAGFLDPINLASAFVPVVGEARMMSLMSAAKGIGQRALIRGGIGAASGAVGSALLEPIIYLGQQEVQADYTLANSLQNLFIGAIMGGGLHSAFGTLAEWRRAKSGKPQPWEYVPPDFTTEEWKNAHAADLYRYQMEATPEADPVDVRQWAEDTAATFDARARNWAWHEKKTVKEFYDQWRPEYRTWQDIEIEGWREAVPDDWRVPGSQVGDKLDDMIWAGPEYAGLKRMNADAMTMSDFLWNMSEWERRFPDMVDYAGIRNRIQEKQFDAIFDWRKVVPDEWRTGTKPGEPLQDLGWAGPEYAGLKRLDADAMTLPEFLDNLALWEERFPDFYDYVGIRQRIEDARAGKINEPDTLLHAMYLDPERDLVNFFRKSRDRDPNSKQSYFQINDERLPDVNARIVSDMPRHQGIDHPAMDIEDNRFIPDILHGINPENTFPAFSQEFFGTSFVGSQIIDGKTFGYVFDIAKNGTLTLKTFFTDNPKAIEHWFNGEKEKAAKRQAENKKAKKPLPPETLHLLGQPFDNIHTLISNFKKPTETLNQSSPATIGKKTQILGANSKEIARYEVRELEDVIPSHDPENQFRKRPDYPEIAQERPYHSDEGEQQKVIGNALGYEPGFVISTDASATNGPPIITKDGIVLGGNSRAMTLQLVYGGHFPEKAAAYRQALVDNAAQFGIDPQAVASMKKPMLVRVISGDLTPEQMAKRSREYNQTTTQQLQGEAEGISRARFVDRPTLNALVAGLKDGKTISEFLASPESVDFAIVLQDAGVLQQTEISSLIYPDSGKLNDAGKARVMQIMRGLVLPDYDIMTSLPKGVLNNLDASIPVLALSRMRGEGWDLIGAFYEAMRLTADAKNRGVPIEQQFFQHTLTGSVDPMRENPAVQALALLFSKTDPKEIRMRMEHYLSLADSEGAGQNYLLPGIRITPEQAFRKAFLETLAFIGNERIPNFNSANNVRHAAIRWAVENGGKSPTIERALNKIEREIAKKKTTPEEKARLLEYKKELAPLSGFVGIREPKFGEFWKDPGKIEIPPGKKPGEKGALPEASHIDEPVVDDPDTLLPPELQENPRLSARGSVRFNAEDRPIVTFFQSANFSTAPHELFHIFRREMERTALSADGSLHSKEQWKRLCDYVGAKPDGVWTVEMEEKFANAGLRYLAEGRAPSPSLQGIFERLKAWFMELFQRAEEIGAEISPEMRKAFDEMFSVPYETADANFRRSMGDLHSREVEQEFADPDTIGKPLSPDDQRLAENTGDLSMVEELTQEAQIRANEAAARLDQNNPELRDVIDETNAELAEIDK